MAAAGYKSGGGRGMPKQATGDQIWNKLDLGLVPRPGSSASVSVSEIAEQIHECPAVDGKVMKQWGAQKSVLQDESGRFVGLALSCDLPRSSAAKRPRLVGPL